MNFKKHHFSFGLLFMVAIMLPSKHVQGQVMPSRISIEEQNKQRDIDKKERPLLYKIHSLRDHKPNLLSNPYRTAFKKPTARASDLMRKYNSFDSGTELWGVVIFSKKWEDEGNYDYYGLYSFNSATPSVLTSMVSNSAMDASCGGVIVDGVFYMAYKDYSNRPILTSWNTDTWEAINDNELLPDLSLIATETATDYKTGKVYGEFYNAQGTALEWGIVDYPSRTRTTIAPATNIYAALGITSDGILYGIASDGNLYCINKDTGEETLVGSTGISFADDEGDFIAQGGEIDQRTNTFYWACYDYEPSSALYTVDLTTGKATKIGDFDGNAQITGITIPPLQAPTGAPDKATDLVLNFPEGQLTGTVSFTIPSTTYGGNPLEGSINYTATIGEQNFTGSAFSGQEVSIEVTLEKAGMTDAYVVLSNSEGTSPSNKISAWLGPDVPEVCPVVIMSIDSLQKRANVCWSCPTRGLHNGYLGTLTYDVYRNIAGKKLLIAEGVIDSCYVDSLSQTHLTTLSYSIVADNNGVKSNEKETAEAIIGSAYDVPYFEDFSNASVAKLYTVVNANHDGSYYNPSTWEYYQRDKCFRYSYNRYNDADDWLITPPIRLLAGKSYKFSLSAHSYNAQTTESFEVKLGRRATAEAMALSVIDTTEVASPYYTKYSNGKLSVAEDGDYCFGIHCVSEKNKYYLYVDSVCIEENTTLEAPDAVTELSVTPASQGTLEATISFTAPMRLQNGNALKVLSHIDILRGGNVVHTFEHPQPGEGLSFKDRLVESGFANYAVVPYSDGLVGQRSNISCYVGLDIPKAPTNPIVEDNLTSIKLLWQPVDTVGTNGGYVSPSDVTYTVYNASSGREEATTADTSCELLLNTNEGQAGFAIYDVSASNSLGTSNYLRFVQVTGKPSSLPYYESFAGGTNSNRLWVSNSGTATFQIVKSSSSDGDGGSAIYQNASKGDRGWLNTRRINLDGTNNPTLSFDYLQSKDVTLEVYVQTHDGILHKLSTPDMEKEGGWLREKVELTDYMGEPYIIVRFLSIAKADNATTGIDRISIRSVSGHDLKATLEAPVNAIRGNSAKIGVRVENIGKYDVNHFVVRLNVDGQEVGAQNNSSTLASDEVATYTFMLPISPMERRNVLRLSANIDFDADMNKADNIAEALVNVHTSALPAPRNLSIECIGETSVLTWEKPQTEVVQVTEDFESYEPWTVDGFGSWSAIDGDRGMASPLWSDTPYPHQGETFAYMVFNPNHLIPGFTDKLPDWAAASGEQYLASIYSNNGTEQLNANDWLISPRLSGSKQTVSLQAKNMNLEIDGKTYKYHETFEFLYSKEGNDTASFKHRVGTVCSVLNNCWSDFTFELPDSARYFAIHRITDKSTAYILMLDNIIYTTGCDAPVGYNIYMDNVKLGHSNNQKYELSIASGVNSFAVTAVYPDGCESAPVELVTTSIDNIVIDNSHPADIYHIDGSLVKKNSMSINGLSSGVYIINGKQVLVK